MVSGVDAFTWSSEAGAAWANEKPDAAGFEGDANGIEADAAGVVGGAPKAGGGDSAGAVTAGAAPKTDPELKTLADVAADVVVAEPKAPSESAVVEIAPNGEGAAVVLVTMAPNMVEVVVAVTAALKGAAEVAVLVSVELPKKELEMLKRPVEGVGLVSELVTTVIGVIVSPDGVLRRAGAGLVEVALGVEAAAARAPNEKLDVVAGVELNGDGVAAIVVGEVSGGVVTIAAVDVVVAAVAVEAGATPKIEALLLVEDPNEKELVPVVGVDTGPKANLGVALVVVVVVAAVEVKVANRVEPEKGLGVALAKKLLVAGVASRDVENG